MHLQMSPLWTLFSNVCICDEDFIVLMWTIGKGMLKSTSMFIQIFYRDTQVWTGLCCMLLTSDCSFPRHSHSQNKSHEDKPPNFNGSRLDQPAPNTSFNTDFSCMSHAAFGTNITFTR